MEMEAEMEFIVDAPPAETKHESERKFKSREEKIEAALAKAFGSCGVATAQANETVQREGTAESSRTLSSNGTVQHHGTMQHHGAVQRHGTVQHHVTVQHHGTVPHHVTVQHHGTVQNGGAAQSNRPVQNTGTVQNNTILGGGRIRYSEPEMECMRRHPLSSETYTTREKALHRATLSSGQTFGDGRTSWITSPAPLHRRAVFQSHSMNSVVRGGRSETFWRQEPLIRIVRWYGSGLSLNSEKETTPEVARVRRNQSSDPNAQYTVQKSSATCTSETEQRSNITQTNGAARSSSAADGSGLMKNRNATGDSGTAPSSVEGESTTSKQQAAGRRRPVSSTITLEVAPKAARLNIQESTKEEAMRQWRQAVRDWFPKMHSKTYFTPPLIFNRVAHDTEEIAGMKVKVPIPSPQLSDVRENEAQQRVLLTFQRLFEDQPEPMVVVSNIIFDNYLNTPTDEVISNEDHPQKSQQPRRNESRIHAGDKDSSLKSQVLSLFTRPRNLSLELKRGKFDMLFVSRKHDLIVCDVKAVGDTFGMQELALSEEKQHAIVRDKVTKALKQLDKEKKVLKDLTSDVQEGLKIRAVLVLPNIQQKVLEKVLLAEKELQQGFRRCFETDDLTKALSSCLFSDHMPPVGLAWEIYDDVIKKLRADWWSKLVCDGSGEKMTHDAYESIVARFCGPATNLHSFTAFQSRADVTILHDAVVETASCMQLPTLTTNQISVVKKSTGSHVFLTGPPGTGKTLMLTLKARNSAQRGNDVIVVSLWHGSETASRNLFQQITRDLPAELKSKVTLVVGRKGNFGDILQKLQRRGAGTPAGQATTAESLDAKFSADENIEAEMREADASGQADGETGKETRAGVLKLHNTSANSLANTKPLGTDKTSSEMLATQTDAVRSKAHVPRSTQSSKLPFPLLVIDEAPWFFGTFVQFLKTFKFECHVWAASPYYGSRPHSFQEVKVTRNLRCPPVVVREVEKGAAYATRAMYHYASGDSGVLSSLPPPTDGPPVKRIPHTHEGHDVWDCEDCGQQVAKFLTEDLLIGKENVTTKNTLTGRLKFSDVMVSGYIKLPSGDSPSNVSTNEGMEIDSPAGFPLGQPEKSQDNISRFLRGLTNGGAVPLQIITKDDPDFAAKITSPTEDRVQVAEPECILGTERPVVVVIGTTDVSATCPRYVDPWSDVIATCVSQLVVVERKDCFDKMQLG